MWKFIGELKIKDIGDNILLFEFKDVLDLERVLEYEPWKYDKHMVVFHRAIDIKSVPFWEFSRATFWVQIHNVPKRSLTQATSESIGNSIGLLIQVADLEDDGVGGEYLRARISIDITKPLPQCRKLWAEGKQVGCVGIRYEHLPYFCYWCGRVMHEERDYELWLQGKGKLKKEDQQFGKWLRVEPIRFSKKTIIIVSGGSHNQAPW